MDDRRVGTAFRAVRLRRGWRQVDVAARAGASRALVSLIERGHIGSVSVDTLRRVAAALEIRIDVIARWRGGELDRLLNAGHSVLEDLFTRWLHELGWEVAPEVSFAIYGERGWIDLLAWHAPTRSLLVIEVKTAIVDVQEMIGIIDRKARLARDIASHRGWIPSNVSALLVVGEGPTNRRRVAAHRALLEAAFPADGRAARTWLRQPAGRFAGLMFFSSATRSSGRSGFSGRQRVRRPSPRLA
jgi:transcriptional regulator with XRE-family HTH domain